MKCSNCKRDLQADEMVCVCGEPLYIAKLCFNNFYLTSNLKIPIELANKGLDPFIICELLIDDKNMIIVEQTVKPGQCFTCEIPLQNVGLGKHSLTVLAYFQGKKVQLPPIGQEIVLDLVPELLITNEEPLKLYPSKDFKIEIRLQLKNANQTYCRIGKISFIDSTSQRVLSQVKTDTLLHQNKPEDSFELQFPKDIKAGSYSGELTAEGVNQFVILRKSLSYKCWRSPDIQLSIGKWGKDDFKFDPIESGQSIYWRSPAGVPTEKRIKLEPKGGEPTNAESSAFVSLYSDVAKFREERLFISEVNTLDLEIPISEKSVDKIKEYQEEGTFEVDTGSHKEPYRLVIDRFEAKAAPLCLSLDFGTTTSCVAVIKPDKEGKFKRDLNSLNIIPLEFSDPFWKLPSLICRRGDKGKEIAFCGQDAKRLKAESKATKRLMVKAIPKNEKDSNCEDGKCIMEAALRRAREWFIEQPRVTEILSNKIIMSVPTSFPLAWKRILSEVCREAANKVFGSKDVSIIEESMAAMSYYLYRERGDKTFPFIIICDFGGGSTDITFLEKEEKGLYLPIKHGGMHSFASNQIDELIIEAFRDSCELTRDQAKTLKENLDTFANFKNELHRLEKRDDIFIRDKWETLQDRIREAIENRFSTCFKEMLQRIKNKWDQNKWEMIQTSKCLILLAGDGSNLAGFRDYIRRAWELTIRKLQMRMDSVEIIQIREPKRCVAIGSFLAYYYHGEEFSEKKITNDVPEDILLHIPPAFEPSDNRRIYDIGGERYYRLFEEGQPLNTDNKVSTIIPLVDTGKTLVKESITFNLFSGLIGDKIEEYLDGKLIPPVDTSMQRLRFTYQAEGADVKIEWVK